MIFTQTIHIDSERCDQHEHLRADALFLLMQNAAGEHAERLGAGRAQLVQSGIAWVLTRVSVRMTRWPKWNSTLTLTTAPGVGRAGLYRRYFTFADEQGPCGHATSLWTVIDLNKRAIVSPDQAPNVPAADGNNIEKQTPRRCLFFSWKGSTNSLFFYFLTYVFKPLLFL